MIHENFVYLGAVIATIGIFAYVRDTLSGRAKPNRVSFFMWALAPLVAFAAQIQKGVGLSSLTTFVFGFNPLLVFAASFLNKKSEWKLTRFDLTCGALSLIGLVLWYITQEGLVAIWFAIFADALAGIPTVRKSWTNPETESISAYLAAAISSGITLLTIKTWTFAYYGFPLWILFICLLIVLLVHFKLGKKFAK